MANKGTNLATFFQPSHLNFKMVFILLSGSCFVFVKSQKPKYANNGPQFPGRDGSFSAQTLGGFVVRIQVIPLKKKSGTQHYNLFTSVNYIIVYYEFY